MTSDKKPGPAPLCGGRELSAWIEQGGTPQRPLKFRALRHRWSAWWFDQYARLAAQKCAHVPLPDDPIFIVGLWRTGSTVLHGALADATGWTTPRTWQCFRPAEFPLMSPPPVRQVGRPMDAGVIETLSPQEDEFAALLLGEPSTYRAFIDPRRLSELGALLENWRRPAAAQRVPLSSRWECFLRAVLARSPGRLLLKSPNHTFRLPWLAERFPRSRFIWLIRRRADVLESNRHMWTAMIEKYGQWHLDPVTLASFLELALENHDDLLDWARSTLADRLHVAAFDDVIHRREHLLGEILEHFE
jgi:hypothetical protein